MDLPDEQLHALLEAISKCDGPKNISGRDVTDGDIVMALCAAVTLGADGRVEANGIESLDDPVTAAAIERGLMVKDAVSNDGSYLFSATDRGIHLLRWLRGLPDDQSADVGTRATRRVRPFVASSEDGVSADEFLPGEDFSTANQGALLERAARIDKDQRDKEHLALLEALSKCDEPKNISHGRLFNRVSRIASRCHGDAPWAGSELGEFIVICKTCGMRAFGTNVWGALHAWETACAGMEIAPPVGEHVPLCDIAAPCCCDGSNLRSGSTGDGSVYIVCDCGLRSAGKNPAMVLLAWNANVVKRSRQANKPCAAESGMRGEQGAFSLTFETLPDRGLDEVTRETSRLAGVLGVKVQAWLFGAWVVAWPGDSPERVRERYLERNSQG